MTDDSGVNHLFDLLPAIYRLRDAQTSGQLRALVDVIAEQLDLVEADIDQLYKNWFIETAEEWAVPYIGDLLGVKPLHAVEGDAGFSLRAYVANTLAYRRRKGTAAVLEDLARAVSGWPARSVEFFQHVQTTQNLNHRSPARSSVDLRARDRLDLLNGPFDTLAHSIDVRPAAQDSGWHNLKRIGLFLWRLKSYPLRDTGARRSVSHPYGYHFHPLGAPVPLFNQPETIGDLSRLSEETDVPAPIRPLAFALDLARYRIDQAAQAPDQRPENSLYYGPDRSLYIRADGKALPPLDCTAWDLSDWDRPPAAVSGLFSGDLSAFPALAAPAQLNATLGGVGPITLTLAGPPPDLPTCREALEAALRSASPHPAFARAVVLLDGSRLLVLPGQVGAAVLFAPAPTNALTAAALKLDAASSTAMLGALSGDLDWLPGPADATPRMMATFATAGPHLVTLISRPNSPAEARALLENALRLAAPGTAEFDKARVLLWQHRLVVLPGTDGAQVSFSAAQADRASVEQFGLANKVGIDVHLGRLAFPLGGEPAAPDTVRVNFSYGFSADMGGGPYLRRGDPREEHPGAVRIAVQKGSATDTLAKALQEWVNGGRKPAVIEILDSGPYEETLVINLPTAGWLRIQGPDSSSGDSLALPHLRFPTALEVHAPSSGAAFILDGLLVEGGLQLFGGLRLEVRHATLVPGQGLNEDGASAFPDRPSLTSGGVTLANMRVVIDHSICGPIILPQAVDGVEVRDSILHAPLTAGGAAQAALAGSLAGNRPGPPLSMERTTVFGKVHVKQIDLASEVIFNDSVNADRRQVGCVRFSYLPYYQNQVPAPYRCQPELALEQLARELKRSGPAALSAAERSSIVNRIKPEYSAEQYGRPAYAQLTLRCPAEIRAGGDQGSEMGAFNRLQQPQREANLQQALPAYLPFGMDIGVIYVS